MAYATNTDLQKQRSNILNLGISDWADQLDEATVIINRDLELLWYRPNAEQYGIDPFLVEMDPTKLLNATDQLTRLGVYKGLELAYEYLGKDAVTDDPFAKFRDYYAQKYKQELDSVVAIGLDYDWDGDGTIEDGERTQAEPRRLTRM